MTNKALKFVLRAGLGKKPPSLLARTLDKINRIREMLTQKKYIVKIVLSFLSGSALLIFLSFLQKGMLGFDSSILGGYFIPLLFGGVSGTIIGIYIIKVKGLNEKLIQRINTLERIMPICSNCKKIRKPNSDPGKMDSWEHIESYISKRTSSQFSHGICPECMEKLYGEILNKDH